MVPSDIDARVAEARECMRACMLCERRCGVDRMEDERGFCGLGREAYVFNELLHFGEELELIPSHAIYLTGCSLRCRFCMTGAHVEPPGVTRGVRLDPVRFGALMRRRRAEGAKNVNFLGGEPSVSLLAALELLREGPRDLPVVWNSNLYYSDRAADLLSGVVDVYLADWKFGNDACAARLADAEGYSARIVRNLERAHASGRLVVRHLVMPGHLACCSEPVLRALARDFPGAPLSLLDPYVPLHRAAEVPGMARSSTVEESRAVRDLAAELDLEVIR